MAWAANGHLQGHMPQVKESIAYSFALGRGLFRQSCQSEKKCYRTGSLKMMYQASMHSFHAEEFLTMDCL